jgi:hypothetical protein
MPASRTTYRGYRVDVFGEGKAWHFAAKPITPDLPILSHNAFATNAESEVQALANARLRIDGLFPLLA